MNRRHALGAAMGSLPALSMARGNREAVGTSAQAASETFAQATPSPASGEQVAGRLIEIIESPEPGQFEFQIEAEVGVNDEIVFKNMSDATHHLVITVKGSVTNKVELETREMSILQLHQGGEVHVECTTHGEGFDLTGG